MVSVCWACYEVFFWVFLSVWAVVTVYWLVKVWRETTP